MTGRLAVLLLAVVALAACDRSGHGDAVAPDSGGVLTPGGSVELSVAGDGFFVVRRGDDWFYTSTATVELVDGRLATPDGLLLEGWSWDGDGLVDPNGPVGDLALRPRDASTDATFEIDRAGTITVRNGRSRPQTLGQVAVADFAEPKALERLRGSLRQPTAGTGAASVGPPGRGRGSVVASATGG